MVTSRKTKLLLVAVLLQTIGTFSFAKEKNCPAEKAVQRHYAVNFKDVKFTLLHSDSDLETFSIHASDGKLTIEGNSQVAMCYAFRYYLQSKGLGMNTWSGQRIEQTEKWPDMELTQITTPYKLRYFLNVCTFGYTTPFWNWERWEKELDWMALHGINFALASVAAEAIAERVWLKLGLVKDEVNTFFTAPAFLPWHRMGNLNSWDGGLSEEWHANQIELQHQILRRMRELDIHPIAPAFAGFVPKAFVDKHPEISFNRLKWGGFSEEYNTYVLPPDSPYFVTIGKMFIEEWESEFGKNRYYLSDSFNEMELPLKAGQDDEYKQELLAQYGETIYRSITAGNPEAVWVTQGWTFGYQHKFWNKKSLKSLLSRIPDDKLIVIDLGNEFPKWVWNIEPTWKMHEGFYNKQWIYSYVPNFGGKNLLTGDLEMYASASVEALHSEYKNSLVGFGAAPEGLENNDVVYELLADMGWRDKAIPLEGWIDSYCNARYGICSDSIRQAWRLLTKSCYSSFYAYPRFTWQTVVPDLRRKSHVDKSATFFRAVELFLSCESEMRNSDLYKSDAIELAAYYLGAKADLIYEQALDLKKNGTGIDAASLLDRTVQILTDMNRLLKSHPLYQLSDWVRMARQCGWSAESRDAYECDAKRLVTTWGGIQNDYSARIWSGLISSYYVPRIQLFFQDGNVAAFEEKWINTPWKDDCKPYTDALREAVKLVNQLK